MCAIVDANAAGEVFGDSPSEAGKFFLDWLDSKGKLVVGGLLRRELSSNQKFVGWLRTALRLGRASSVQDAVVDAEAEALRSRGICSSNDHHVLGLARVSGARLLFTNDYDLQQDFKKRRVLGGNTTGRVYSTLERKEVRPAHRNLLRRTDLCEG